MLKLQHENGKWYMVTLPEEPKRNEFYDDTILGMREPGWGNSWRKFDKDYAAAIASRILIREEDWGAVSLNVFMQTYSKWKGKGTMPSD